MKKTLVLTILFVFPIVVYLFFASGVTHFGKLAVLTNEVDEVSRLDASVSFTDKITILGFLGSDVQGKRGNAFNLNQKIYKRFSEFDDFQFVMVVKKGFEKEVTDLKKELGHLGNINKWQFVFGDEQTIFALFNSLDTDLSLDEKQSTPFVFIIDKDRNLRGRNDDEDEGIKYGFRTDQVADLNNKMEDDVKIILAEYRLALKKNTTRPNEKE
ncbi:hypothetical protein U1E44_00830 [Arenibacter sp. GZD96]|uniref:hypothetical protein n=1 Tax=Aurantibrevibacter litoralis TaxID=3106030 RepID=UPI002AFE4074|nr:hypothetical protein [Arenibacter sp. GZD-96]MEA1784623.1 hypothetical protein [Arenibacter sp. GZD-96]